MMISRDATHCVRENRNENNNGRVMPRPYKKETNE